MIKKYYHGQLVSADNKHSSICWCDVKTYIKVWKLVWCENVY